MVYKIYLVTKELNYSIHPYDMREYSKELLKIGRLKIQDWITDETVDVDFKNTTILLLFSKKNCKTCVDEIFDLLNKRKYEKCTIYLISTDIMEKHEIEIFYAKYKKYLGFFKLGEISFSQNDQSPLPLLIVANSNKEVLMKKSIVPIAGIRNDEEDKLFWKRFSFLLDLLQ